MLVEKSRLGGVRWEMVGVVDVVMVVVSVVVVNMVVVWRCLFL